MFYKVRRAVIGDPGLVWFGVRVYCLELGNDLLSRRIY